MRPGTAANRSGKTAEDVIEVVLSRKGLVYERQRPIGRGIYGTGIRADFYLPAQPGIGDGLIIESKWQDSSGSVDEKFPYLVANIYNCYPLPAIIVIGGNGIRPGAMEWLRDRVDRVRLLAVFDISEFMSWAQRR